MILVGGAPQGRRDGGLFSLLFRELLSHTALLVSGICVRALDLKGLLLWSSEARGLPLRVHGGDDDLFPSSAAL